MDFLEAMRRRNPELIRVSSMLHSMGEIPSDTYVADLDQIRMNASGIGVVAAEQGVVGWFEAKQFGRNPVICSALIEAGFTAAIAIDVEEAIALHDHGMAVAHLGHLGQPAKADVEWVVGTLRPEVITVYTLERAAALGRAAAALDRVQGLLLRVIGPDDLDSRLVGGGTREEALVSTARAVAKLPGVRLLGVTTYPALRYDVRARAYVSTPNLETLIRARETLRAAGFDVPHVNAAGNACVATIPQLAGLGVTHVEPGQAFVGATPGHFFEDFEEVPAIAYVTEVAYLDGDDAYAFASGMVCNSTIGIWNALLYDRILACAGSDPDTVVDRCVTGWPQSYAHSDPSAFMYARLRQGRDVRLAVGDTLIYGFRAQLYRANNARLAVLEGIQAGSPRVIGLFDRTGNQVAAHTLRAVGGHT